MRRHGRHGRGRARRCSTPAMTRRSPECRGDVASPICRGACGRTPCRSCSATRTTGAACARSQHLARALPDASASGLSMHSNSHLGVSLMAMTHAAAAAPHLTYACDTHYPWQHADDEVVAGGRIRFVDGCVANPDQARASASISITMSSRAAASATRAARTASATTKPKCAKHVDPTWKRSAAALVRRLTMPTMTPVRTAIAPDRRDRLPRHAVQPTARRRSRRPARQRRGDDRAPVLLHRRGRRHRRALLADRRTSTPRSCAPRSRRRRARTA